METGTLTFMRKLGEPGARFRAAAPNHPEALLEEPQAVQAVGQQLYIQGTAIESKVI